MYEIGKELKNEIQTLFDGSIVIGDEKVCKLTGSLYFPIYNRNTGEELSINMPLVSDKFLLSRMNNGRRVIDDYKEHLISELTAVV